MRIAPKIIAWRRHQRRVATKAAPSQHGGEESSNIGGVSSSRGRKRVAWRGIENHRNLNSNGSM